MAYATIEDIEVRTGKTYTNAECWTCIEQFEQECLLLRIVIRLYKIVLLKNLPRVILTIPEVELTSVANEEVTRTTVRS